jgi:hypothetical protein
MFKQFKRSPLHSVKGVSAGFNIQTNTYYTYVTGLQDTTTRGLFQTASKWQFNVQGWPGKRAVQKFNVKERSNSGRSSRSTALLRPNRSTK